MPAPDQDEAIADAIKFGRALGVGSDQQIVLAISRYLQQVKRPYQDTRSMVKIMREMEEERFRPLMQAAKPFVDMLEPDFDDVPFTSKELSHGQVHMMLMGGGELGDLPLAKFRDLRNAYLGAH